MAKATTPSERLLAAARKSIERNELEDARQMLEAAIKHDGSDPRPWLMLASIAPSPRERRALLAQAERLQGAAVSGGTLTAIAPAAVPTVAAVAAPTQVVPAPAGRRWPAVLAGVALLLAGLLLVGFLARGSLTGALAGAVEPTRASAAAVEVGLVMPTAIDEAAEPSVAVRAPATEATVPATAAVPSPEVTPPVKQVVAGQDPLATWTPTSEPTPTLAPTLTPSPTPEPTATPEPPPPGSPRPLGVGASERWINVNLTTQTLVAYEGDTPVFETLVSSGLFQWPTVTGQYRTYIKYESQTMNGYLLGYDYYLPDVPYVMYFFEDYAIHGAYWHNNFGTPMSHGCVNVSPADAGWLFNWAPLGTLVNINY